MALLIMASSLLAIVYIWRVVETAYLQPAPEGVVRKEAPLWMLLPTWGLAALSVFFGAYAALTTAAASRAAAALVSASHMLWQ